MSDRPRSGMGEVARTLWYDTNEGRARVAQGELLDRPECLVILGEAGMGKTTLLKSLEAQEGARFRRARDFINDDADAYRGDNRPLVIDAIDEVPAKADGDAVDTVLRQLRAAGFPRFLLSCRVADWRGATAREAIAGQYAELPLELHLDPFDESQATAFLADKLQDEAKAEAVVEHFHTRGLSEDVLGNPQTLELIARVANDLPDTKGELFDRAVDVLWSESNDAKEQTSLDRHATLDAAGAAFAAILLTGSSAIVRKGAANVASGELGLKEVEAFDSGNVERAMASRLFSATGVDRFSYWHRRVGEFLAAKWLAGKADTRGKRKRLLAIFHASGAVPTSLRGVHAWLARDFQLAEAVIAADPMGLIEYGDADALSEFAGRALLQALVTLSKTNPRFRGWGPYRAKALVQPALLPEVRDLILDAETEYGLRLLLLQQLAGTQAAKLLRDDLLALARDQSVYYGARSAAIDSLILIGGLNWSELVEELRTQATHDSTRLAVSTMNDAGLDQLSDRQIVETVMAHAGLSLIGVSREEGSRTFGHVYLLGREIPDERLDGVLDELSSFAGQLLPKYADIEDNELIDLAHALILRRLELGQLNPMTLWHWMAPFTEQARYDRDNAKKLATWLREHHDTRRSIQQHVLLRKGSGKNIAQRMWRLSARSGGLTMTEEDVVAMLGVLHPADRQDMRWREILRQTLHDADHGEKARKAAKSFAGNNLELVAWIDGLPHHIPDYEKRQAERGEQQRRKRLTQQEEARRAYRDHIGDVKAGTFQWVVNPARAYLNRYSDLERDKLPYDRLVAWLGQEIADDVLSGFEQFLVAKPADPNASKIARSAAEGIYWHAQDIIVAALAERRRLERGFTDLSAERIMAGLYALRMSDERQEGITGLAAALRSELRRRDKWRSALLLEFGPRFAKRQQHVVGLYELMRSTEDAVVAADLAAAWLVRYPAMSREAEVEMIDCLILAGRADDLRLIADQRALQQLDDERRRTWDAVQFLIDFEAAQARLVVDLEPELLWHIRARAGDRRSAQESLTQSSSQLRWLVEKFRVLWPAVYRPSGVTSGDNNKWDASDYLLAMINRLGDQTSAEAINDLAALRAADEDGYTESIKIAQAEQRQKTADEAFVSLTLDGITAVLTEDEPRTVADLQAVMLETLDEVQLRLKGDPLDWYTGFYRDIDGRHKNEEPCRDELLKLLIAIAPKGVDMRPEAHGADDKRLDIECSAGRSLMVPIEVKGQWHPKLWTAADDQLDALYTPDWRADRRGIYLVLWFGSPTLIASAPGGEPTPTTPGELQLALTNLSLAARDGRVVVRVIDLTRPT